jgi:adenosylcobinamide-phosphate synthase
MSFLVVVLLCFVAVVLDVIFAEPKRWHPLVGFGRLASWLEGHCNRPGFANRIWGVFAVLVLLIPFTLFSSWLAALPSVGWAFSLLGLYLCIGYQSLREHVLRVRDALLFDDLDSSREAVGRIVSRNTEQMDEKQVAKAAVESTLENANDALFAALFWFVIAGLPGVILYRLSNTLDAMWGYKSDRYRYFGWFAARLDDVLNYLPARLCALAYLLVGNWEGASQSWRTQAKHCDSPNAGVVMSAGAGALNVSLGGRAVYDGVLTDKPELGLGPDAQPNDIQRALDLVRRSLWVWLLALLMIALALAV